MINYNGLTHTEPKIVAKGNFFVSRVGESEISIQLRKVTLPMAASPKGRYLVQRITTLFPH